MGHGGFEAQTGHRPGPDKGAEGGGRCNTCFSHIGTAHDCSERRDTSKNVLVPKSAKQMGLVQALWGHTGQGLCIPAPQISDVQALSEAEGEALADLSLLCLWPFGNSLTETVHSEFYQCHTQNRSHTLQPADPEERPAAPNSGSQFPAVRSTRSSFRPPNLSTAWAPTGSAAVPPPLPPTTAQQPSSPASLPA